jgi:hypothetical protein
MNLRVFLEVVSHTSTFLRITEFVWRRICTHITFSLEHVDLPQRDLRICIHINFSLKHVDLPERDFTYFLPFSDELVVFTESGFTYFYLTLVNLWFCLEEVSHTSI